MQTFTARTEFKCPNCGRKVRVNDTIRWFDAEQGTYQHDECPSARESRHQSPKQAAFYFFLKNAGSSCDPKIETARQGKARGARRLAKAERDACALGYTFEWEQDQDGCIGCDCDDPECKCSTGEDHECLVCLMRDSAGSVVQSLGSICGPSREYGRVIEAELALEELN